VVCRADAETGRPVTAVYGHRGCTEGPRENTLEAFVEARRRGADGVEFDVRRAADGALVVHHDAHVEGVGLICETPVARLPDYVPLLSQVIEACDDMEMNVEVKNHPGDPGYDPSGSLARAVAAELAEQGRLDGVVVSSFDAPTIEAVRAAEAALPIGWLLGGLADLDASLAAAVRAGYQALHPQFARVTASFVERCHLAGLAINVWTPNTDDELEAMFVVAVDTVITDRLSAALAAAARHAGLPGGNGELTPG
jgi:glycerophosphoryl diester phosphodiesterase